HAIVKIVLDGKTIWVDPTVPYQGGSLPIRHLRRFGKALVVQSGVRDLESIPERAADNTLRKITSTFKIDDYKAPTLLTVKTCYRGTEADNNREYFARNSRQEILKNYLNFYARYYPDVGEAAPLEVQDDRTNNLITVIEHYQVPDFWKT